MIKFTNITQTYYRKEYFVEVSAGKRTFNIDIDIFFPKLNWFRFMFHGVKKRSLQFPLFFNDFMYLFLESGRAGERVEEKDQRVCLSRAPYW